MTESPSEGIITTGDAHVVDRPAPDDTESPLQKLDRLLDHAPEQGIKSPRDLATALTAAGQAHIDGLDDRIAKIREFRAAPSSGDMRRYDLSNICTEAIVVLAQNNQLDLAEALLRSTGDEMPDMNEAAAKVILDDTERTTVLETLTNLYTPKRQALEEEFTDKEVDSELQYTLFHDVRDPDSARGLDKDQWATFAQLPDTVRFHTFKGANIKTAIDDVLLISEHGAMNYDPAYVHISPMLDVLASLETPQEKEAYLASLKAAYDMLPSGDNEIEKRSRGKLISNLARLPNITAQHVEAAMRIEEASRTFNYGNALAAIDNFTTVPDVEAYTENLVEALRIASRFSDLNTTEIVEAEDPLAFANTLIALEPLIRKERGIRRIVPIRLNSDETYRLVKYAQADLALQKRGIDLQGMRRKEHNFFTTWLTEEPHKAKMFKDETDRERGIFYDNFQIMSEYQEVYRKHKHLADPGTITLDDVPSMQERFSNLGVNQELAEAMFASWSTFNGYIRETSKLPEQGAKATGNQLREAAKKAYREQSLRIAEQTQAVSTYIEQYGIEEFQTIVDTFGIYNFARCSAEQLHTQLDRWQTGTHPVKDVAVCARADWNGALGSAGTTILKLFDEDGLFIFEANSAIDLARISIAIKKRERDNGREPDAKNGLIDAHASPEGLLLGVNGERIAVEDFLEPKQKSDERAEDFALRKQKFEARQGTALSKMRENLGTRIRLILLGCNAAAEGMNGENIKTALHERYGMQVDATTEKPTGVIINHDDTVSFKTERGITNAV